jgi:hypothetical protein
MYVAITSTVKGTTLTPLHSVLCVLLDPGNCYNLRTESSETERMAGKLGISGQFRLKL